MTQIPREVGPAVYDILKQHGNGVYLAEPILPQLKDSSSFLADLSNTFGFQVHLNDNEKDANLHYLINKIQIKISSKL